MFSAVLLSLVIQLGCIKCGAFGELRICRRPNHRSLEHERDGDYHVHFCSGLSSRSSVQEPILVVDVDISTQLS